MNDILPTYARLKEQGYMQLQVDSWATFFWEWNRDVLKQKLGKTDVELEELMYHELWSE